MSYLGEWVERPDGTFEWVEHEEVDGRVGDPEALRAAEQAAMGDEARAACAHESPADAPAGC